jgi:hypothetical protein
VPAPGARCTSATLRRRRGWETAAFPTTFAVFAGVKTPAVPEWRAVWDNQLHQLAYECKLLANCRAPGFPSWKEALPLEAPSRLGTRGAGTYPRY